jgi:hypothetical protein
MAVGKLRLLPAPPRESSAMITAHLGWNIFREFSVMKERFFSLYFIFR